MVLTASCGSIIGSGGGGDGNGAITSANFASGSTLYSGVLTGEASSVPEGGVVQARFDGGEWIVAQGTANWRVLLPHPERDEFGWTLGSRHTIELAVAVDGEVGDIASYQVTKGVNKDIDGDGYSDVVVGAWQSNAAGPDRGAAYVFRGGAAGLDVTPAQTLVYPGEDDDARFGHTSSLGDYDGDGYADILVGAHASDLTGLDAGAVFLYLGSPSGVLTEPDEVITYPEEDIGALFGISVSNVGDANNDGYDDFIVGAYRSDLGAEDAGAVYVFRGRADSAIGTHGQTLVYPGADPSSNFGRPVSAAGDLNGDGFADIVVGASASDAAGPNNGAAYVYFGGETGFAPNPDRTLLPPDPDNVAQFGISVSWAGDTNGDGFGDLVIGAAGSDQAGANRGAAYVFHGSSVGPKETPDHRVLYDGPDDEAAFGRSVAAVGDVNGDGYGDILVGAYLSSASGVGVQRGAAFVYFGSETGVIGGLTRHAVFYPGQDDQTFFGRSVSSAGDVDGDGLSDFIVGASRTDVGGADRGSAYVYRGDATRLLESPTHMLVYPGSDDSAYFGTHVARP